MKIINVVIVFSEPALRRSKSSNTNISTTRSNRNVALTQLSFERHSLRVAKKKWRHTSTTPRRRRRNPAKCREQLSLLKQDVVHAPELRHATIANFKPTKLCDINNSSSKSSPSTFSHSFVSWTSVWRWKWNIADRFSRRLLRFRRLLQTLSLKRQPSRVAWGTGRRTYFAVSRFGTIFPQTSSSMQSPVSIGSSPKWRYIDLLLNGLTAFRFLDSWLLELQIARLTLSRRSFLLDIPTARLRGHSNNSWHSMRGERQSVTLFLLF